VRVRRNIINPGTKVLEVTQLEKTVCKSEAAPIGGDTGAPGAPCDPRPLGEKDRARVLTGREARRVASLIGPSTDGPKRGSDRLVDSCSAAHNRAIAMDHGVIPRDGAIWGNVGATASAIGASMAFP
jgi:hypothetical protein